jgi:hypothetical protein
MERKRGPAVTRRTALAGVCRANIDEESVSPAPAERHTDPTRFAAMRRLGTAAFMPATNISHRPLCRHQLLYTFTAFD